MKAADLQIGDLICLKDDTKYELPLKVDGIIEDDISVEGDGFLGGIEGLIRPIQLTPEILEKNGFTKVNSQRYDYGYPDTDCYVKVNPKKNMIHVNGRNANSNLYSHSFVHELQRALRLCGLDEIADNFKV